MSMRIPPQFQRKHPLSRGLIFTAAPSLTSPKNMITGNRPAVLNCTEVLSDVGPGLKCDGGTDYIEYSTNPVLERALYGLTVVVGWTQHAAFNRLVMPVVQKCKDPYYHSWQLRRDGSNSQYVFEVRLASGAAYPATATNTISVGDSVVMCGRWAAGGKVTLCVLDMRTRVILSSAESAATLAGPIDYTGTEAQRTLRVARNESTADGKGTLHFMHVWQRRLSDREVAAMMLDPTAIWRPRSSLEWARLKSAFAAAIRGVSPAIG